MAQKRGYWYTKPVNGIRYRIKGSFLANEWKLIQFMLKSITDNDLCLVDTRQDKMVTILHTEMLLLLDLTQKEFIFEFDRLLESFTQRVIWAFDASDEDMHNYEIISMFNSMSFRDQKYSFYVNYQAIPYLHYQKHNLDQEGFAFYFDFASSFSGALYSTLKKIKASNFTISVDELRQLFGATSASYNDLRNFKLRILNPAVNEISNLTDIHLTYIENKLMRKTESITFTWQKKV